MFLCNKPPTQRVYIYVGTPRGYARNAKTPIHMARTYTYSNAYKNAYKRAKEDKFMTVIREIAVEGFVSNGMTYHAKVERAERRAMMAEYLKDDFEAIAIFEVRYAHKDCNEIHKLYKNGIVEVYSVDTHIMVTTYCHKVGEIRAYWDDVPRRRYPAYYWDLVSACGRNYPVYKMFCRDADLYKVVR